MTKRIPGVPQGYEDLTMRIRDMYRELNTGDDDRVFRTIGGMELRLREIKTGYMKTKVVLEMKWPIGWSPTTVEKATEYLYSHRRSLL